MEEGKRFPLSRKIFESDLAHIVDFPISVQCSDSVLECVKCYNLKTREVKTIDDKLIVKLGSVSFSISCG